MDAKTLHRKALAFARRKKFRDAEDLAQEAVIHIRPGQTVAQAVIDAARRSMGRPGITIDENLRIKQGQIPVEHRPTATHINEDRIALEQAMEYLSAEEREFFKLRYYHDMEIKEIAAQLGVTQGRVSQRFSAIYGKLRKILSR